MQIKLSPIRSDAAPLTLHRIGDVLTVNGEAFDLSAIPEGATLPREAVTGDWLASDIERIAGQLHLTVTMPHGANAPEETRFPAPILVATDGDIALPPFDAPEEDQP